MGENGPASMTVGVPKFSHLCSVCGATLHNCMPLSRSLTELIARHESLQGDNSTESNISRRLGQDWALCSRTLLPMSYTCDVRRPRSLRNIDWDLILPRLTWLFKNVLPRTSRPKLIFRNYSRNNLAFASSDYGLQDEL